MMRIYFAAGVVLTLMLSVLGHHAVAATLTSSFKAPLTVPYAECGTETSTSDCTTGSMELTSPWTFSAGTIEIDENEVSLRLDDIELRPGLTCTEDVGGSTRCNCWDDDNGYCEDEEDCNSGTAPCGPAGYLNSGDTDYFIVYIYMQDLFSYGGTTKIRRDINCHPVVYFDLKNNVNTNQNRQVNATQTVDIDGCGINSEAHGVEIRHIEIKDKWGHLVAKVTH